jgi:hypothetical protein
MVYTVVVTGERVVECYIRFYGFDSRASYCRHDFPNPLSPGKLLSLLFFCIIHIHRYWIIYYMVSFYSRIFLSLQKISLHDVYKQMDSTTRRNYRAELSWMSDKTLSPVLGSTAVLIVSKRQYYTCIRA